MDTTAMYPGVNAKNSDAVIPHIIYDSKLFPSQLKFWARLIQMIYELDPLHCLKCDGLMKIIAFIDNRK